MKRFEDDMGRLLETTRDLGSLVCSTIDGAVRAFCERDTDLAREMAERYQRISDLHSVLEEDTLRILTLYQPTAVDMRTVATVLKAITYLERIGKYSKKIAKATIFLSDDISAEGMEGIPEMGSVAVRMVKLAVGSLIDGDTSGLDEISQQEHFLDTLRNSVIRRNTELLRDCPAAADVLMRYMSVSRYLERVGDNSCDIAEKVAYMVTGRHVEIGA
ncbi:MAG: phosphate signaling complex protein PhoU [Candidatus Methanomethylophilaceae archaeon]|jgi:phosphate transport system protein|nr:phosphate signaling complex protein PhoU [Candidatus Methanomethylophilaceae archaeon]NLF34265.1 phosphate signaling complex protein PhoU [Thermoplasmatales archaeon]